MALDYSPKQKFSEIDGGTPLHVAAANNHPLTAHILLQAGADINAFDDNNETPLMIAAYNVSYRTWIVTLIIILFILIGFPKYCEVLDNSRSKG